MDVCSGSEVVGVPVGTCREVPYVELSLPSVKCRMELDRDRYLGNNFPVERVSFFHPSIPFLLYQR